MANEITKAKWMTGSYQYQLNLGAKVEDPKGVITPLTLTPAKNVSVKIDNTEYALTLQGVKFSRKIYEPGLIEAEVAISPVMEVENVEELLNMRTARLDLLNTATDATENNKVTTIAQNYYVFKVNPQIVMNNGKSSLFVKLTIHSMDKLMDIEKYSMSYTARKLGSDILENEAKAFGFKAQMVKPNSKSLRNLRYLWSSVMKDDAGKDVTVSISSEFIQPYLVQYNETFHDFLVRTSNRCGEFLYFENGELVLGLPETEQPEQIDTYASVTFQNYSCGPMEVETFSRDSMKDDDQIGDYNFDLVDKDSAGYPEEIFPDKLQYNSSLAQDEYIFPLEKGKWSDLARELYLHTEDLKYTLSFRAVSEFVACDDGNIPNLIASGAAQMAADTLNAKLLSDTINSDCDKGLFGDKSPYYNKSEQNNGSRVVQFSSLSKEGWTTAEFYQNIREHEVEQQKKVICIDMGTQYVPIKLGEKIKVKGLKGNYIVIQVNQVSNVVWTRNYNRFDPNDKSDLYSSRQSQVIYAIPTYQEGNDEKAIPPVGPLPPIRKAGPQTAFVIDSNDPKYQDRVRISYPWQSSDNKKRMDMFQAQADLKKAQAEEKEKENKVNNLLALLMGLRKDIDLLEEVKDLSKDDLTKRIKEKKEKQTKLENDLVELDKALATENAKTDSITKLVEVKTIEQSKKSTQTELERVKQDRTLLEELVARKDKGETNPVQTMIKAKEDERKNQQEEKDKADKALESAQKNTTTKKEDLDKKTSAFQKYAEKSASPWVRIAVPMATNGGGIYCKPSKGDEVLVNYDGDNVERPYVVGSVYSKNLHTPGDDLDRADNGFLQKRSPLVLMSPNGQHITFNAPGDGWKFIQGFSPILKTLQGYFPGLKPKCFTGDEKELCGGIYMSDLHGLYEFSLSSHDRKVKLNSPYGNVEIGAFTGIKINAPNGDIKICGKNVTIEAGNNLTLKSGTNVDLDDDEESALKDIFKPSPKDMVTTVVDTIKDNTVGSILSGKVIDFALLRCVMEVLMRPIEGTMQIKSSNYVMLEAGKGKAQVPIERYAKSFQDKNHPEHEKDRQIFYAKTIAYIKKIDERFNQFSQDYMELKENAYAKKETYEKGLNGFMQKGAVRPELVKLAFKNGDDEYRKMDEHTYQGGTISQVLTDQMKIDKFFVAPPNGWKVLNNPPSRLGTEIIKYMRPVVEEYGMAIDQLQKRTRQFKDLFSDTTIRLVNQSCFGKDKDDATEWIDKAFKKVLFDGADSILEQGVKAWQERYGKPSDAAPKEKFMGPKDLKSEKDPFANIKLLKRKAIALFLAELAEDEKNKDSNNLQAKFFKISYAKGDVNDQFIKDKWMQVVDLGDVKFFHKNKGLGLIATIAGGIDKVLNLKEGLVKGVSPLVDLKKPYWGWAHKVWGSHSGQIIFSSKKGTTYALNGEQNEKFDFGSETKTHDNLKKTLQGI